MRGMGASMTSPPHGGNGVDVMRADASPEVGAMTAISSRLGWVRPALASAAASAVMLALLVGPVLAASQAAGGHGEEGHGASGGMPQLDPASFPTQIFWLIVTFALLYIAMAKVALPRVTDILEDRDRRIVGDLDRAAQLRDEATQLAQQVERDLVGARSEAQELLRSASNESAREQSARLGEAAGIAAKKVAEAEGRIAAARDAAMSSVRNIAVDVVRSASMRVAGLDVTEQAAADMVDLVMRERG